VQLEMIMAGGVPAVCPRISGQSRTLAVTLLYRHAPGKQLGLVCHADFGQRTLDISADTALADGNMLAICGTDQPCSMA
jgi:hypothetical protein